MPGSQSAGVAESLSNAWRQRFHGWYDDAPSQRGELDTSADEYDAADHRALTRQQNVGPRKPGLVS